VIRGEKDGDALQAQNRKESSLVIPDGRNRRKQATGGDDTTVAEIQKWEDERVARHVVD